MSDDTERDELAAEFEGQVADDLEKRAEEASLYPAGYYKAQLQAVTIYRSDTETFTIKSGPNAGNEMDNPFYQVPVGNFKFASYAWRKGKKDEWDDTSDKPFTRMVKGCFKAVDRFDRLSDESAAGGMLVGAARKGGCEGYKDPNAVVEWLKNHFVVIHYAQTKGSDTKPKRNFIISIEPWKEEG